MADNKKIQMINVFPYVVFFACLVHIGLSIQSSKGIFVIDSDLHYINCSPSNLCYSCFNEFFCNQCAPSAKCCPKYCTTCKNTTYCNTCEKGFDLIIFNGRNDWRACQNTNPQIDRNREPFDITKCKQGFYLDAILQYCEQCLIPFCKTCHQQAMNCLQCQEGYHFSGDICIINQAEPTPIPIPIPPSQQEQGAMYVLMILFGMIMGFFIACFIIQIYSCTKRGCKGFCNWCRDFFNRRKINKQRERLNYVEMNIDAPIISSLSDQQKQFAFKSQFQQNKQKIHMPYDYIDVRRNKKPVITQARNNY